MKILLIQVQKMLEAFVDVKPYIVVAFVDVKSN